MESTPISSQALPAGTRIEEFVIERVLGSGGFGITYLAKDSSLGRQVVIKENLPVQFCFRDPASMTVAPRHSHGEDADNFQWSLENFSKEAATLASLHHHGIVPVHRSFQAFGTAYFVMPYVEGMTLDDLIVERRGRKQAFAEEELVGLLKRVLDALGYLHDRGIYHRDLKPGNILISNGAIPVLIDFGSARQRLSERSMTVIESPGYTPFEQLQSRGNVGPWSDLYALGATLVKVITGDALPKSNDRVFDDPWQALTSRDALLRGHSSGLLESIDRAVALKPCDRWQDAGQWLVAITSPSENPTRIPQNATASCREPLAPPVTRTSSSPIHLPGEERDFQLAENVEIRMCWIPPGEFLMGSPVGELGRQKGETQHLVCLSRGYWMAKYPVTQSQWQAVTGNRPSHFGSPGLWMDWFGDPEKDVYWRELPVEQVTWWDICGNLERTGTFLGRANSNAPKGLQFDLPTEAEWEYACRANTKTAIHSGMDLTSKYGTCDHLEVVAWYDENSFRKSHPVAAAKPNAWGLHDMHGNMWEWCADWYGAYSEGGVTDPRGAISGSSRVLRGGAWNSYARECRAASRKGFRPEYYKSDVGFRLVLRPVEPSQ